MTFNEDNHRRDGSGRFARKARGEAKMRRDKTPDIQAAAAAASQGGKAAHVSEALKRLTDNDITEPSQLNSVMMKSIKSWATPSQMKQIQKMAKTDWSGWDHSTDPQLKIARISRKAQQADNPQEYTKLALVASALNTDALDS